MWKILILSEIAKSKTAYSSYITTIMVYNSVDHSYIRNTTDKLNARINKGQIYGYSGPNDEIAQQYTPIQEPNKEPIKQELAKESSLTDEEFDRKLAEMLREQEERKRRRREKDFEM